MKATQENNRTKKVVKKTAKRIMHETEELKTDAPLSEKDEVKKAEQNTQKNIRR